MRRNCFVLLLLLSLNTCKNNPGIGPVSKTVIAPVPVSNTPDTDIYFAGYISNGANGIATLWRNNNPANLTPSALNSVAQAITVNGNDIYIAGYYRINTSKQVAVYWKNGVMKKLSDSSAFYAATAIAVDGNDIYVAGYVARSLLVSPKPVYWKNGIRVALPVINSTFGVASAIAIQNSDI